MTIIIEKIYNGYTVKDWINGECVVFKATPEETAAYVQKILEKEAKHE